MIYVNPDDFLGSPRLFTDERNREAWRACKNLVETTLNEAARPYNYYLVCGVQGAGKTRWVKSNTARFAEPAIVFDAAHARACERGSRGASTPLLLSHDRYLGLLPARPCLGQKSHQAQRRSRT